MAIPHVDVKAQYAPLIPELQEAFARTLDTARFIFGPEVEAFEREAADYLGVQETVSVANGTDALVIVLDALGIGPGDEVVCPAFTFYATAESMPGVARRRSSPRSTQSPSTSIRRTWSGASPSGRRRSCRFTSSAGRCRSPSCRRSACP